MWFTSLDDVRQFAGEDYARAVVPEAARRILSRFDAESVHYEVRIPRRPEQASWFASGAPSDGQG